MGRNDINKGKEGRLPREGGLPKEGRKSTEESKEVN